MTRRVNRLHREVADMSPLRTPLLTAIALLAGCGGGDDGNSTGGGGGGGGGSALPNAPVSSDDASVNAARLGDLNGLRSQCDGTVLQGVTPLDALIVSAIRHAGWQAIDDAGLGGRHLNHGEPRVNALFSSDHFVDRIRAANGGTGVPAATLYFEDIASSAGSTAIVQLWNSVYHRIPMMRHRARSLGYGDMALARADYPTAGVPLIDEWGNVPPGNGYATLEWAGYATPAITLSFWPGDGTSGVPRTFASDTESPDPVSGRNQVGCPIHVILPETSGAFTSVVITLATGGTHVPLHVLAGNGSPSGAGGDVVSLVGDAWLGAAEVFIIPLPAPTDTGLAGNTAYTYRVQLTFNGTAYDTGDVTYTTAP
jgi:hypothetical protein